MKTCSVCDRKITPAMVRHGGALSRGGALLHRECHRAFEQNRGGGRPPAAGHEFADEAEPGRVDPVAVQVEFASFGRRLGAHLIDSVILILVTALITVPVGVLAVMRSGGDPASMSMSSILGSIVSILLPVLYCVLYWTRKGATPGKTALGIRVVNGDDHPPTGIQSMVRYLAYFLSSLPFCLGYAWMIWDREKRCWHDIVAGTRVIRA